jgi:predicted ATPase
MERRYINSARLKAAIDPDSYLSAIPAVKYLSGGGSLEFDRDVTFFVGENGTGKSTLIEAIAVAFGFNAEGGTRNFNFSTARTHSTLCKHLTLSRGKYAHDGFFLRAESFYNVATHIQELDEIPAASAPISRSYGGSLHEKSHGESFMALVQNRFVGDGLYVLDEPEAALSPTRQMTLLAEMAGLVGARSQFIIATHSPIIMAYPDAKIYLFSDDGVRETPYRQTEHYQITRRFLENPERMLHYLLGDSPTDD